MKILVICYEHPPVGGGGGRVASQIAQALAKRGHEVGYLTGNVGKRGKELLPTEEVIDGVRVWRVATNRRTVDTCSVPEMFFYLVYSLFPAIQRIRAWKPDIVHAHFAVPSGAVAFAAAVFSRVPYVLTVHLGDVPGGVPEQTDKLFRFLKPFTVPIWRCAKGVTAVSSYVATLTEKAYGSRPEVIPNGVAMEPVREISAISDPVRLLWVGRMSVQKNPLLALEALAHIREENWKLEMVGDGPLRRNAENFAEQMGIASKVCFHGWLESSEVWRLQRECPILLLTSLHEGMPMVAVEGLMAGMAILSTCIPGVEDVVEDDWNGRKMPFHPDLIGNEIISLLRDPKRLFFYRTNSQKKAREFSLERVVEKYEFILTKKSKK